MDDSLWDKARIPTGAGSCATTGPMVVENVVLGFHLLRVATKVVKRILLSQEERGFLPATT